MGGFAVASRRRIAVLGSTGSIGRSVLNVVAANPDSFDIVSLSALSNVELLASQAEQFGARRVAVGRQAVDEARLPRGVEIDSGPPALEELASDPEVDLVVNALVGTAGLTVTAAAVRAGKRLAIANKESLVMAGDSITRTAGRTGSELIPVDSEHSSIFRCIRGAAEGEVTGVVLTASGGPLRDLPPGELSAVSVEAVLDHPTWDMGDKITVDSATMANKAMEVIEARWLFGLALDEIEVVIHRESIVHSFVRMSDGSLLAHLGTPDMRIPIQYALFYPEAPSCQFSAAGPAELGSLSFSCVEKGRYPCFDLILGAAREGGTAPATACVADEVAVRAFLDGSIGFGDLPTVIERTLRDVPARSAEDLDTVVDTAEEAKVRATAVVAELAGVGEGGTARSESDAGSRGGGRAPR
jgi:1-deoxy-D-xylulose-5-phosphate reductoisomerase